MRAKRRFCFQHDMDEVVAEHAQAAAASESYRDAVGLWPFEIVRWTSRAEAEAFVKARFHKKVGPICADDALEVWALAAETSEERRQWMNAVKNVLLFNVWAAKQRRAGAPAAPSTAAARSGGQPYGHGRAAASKSKYAQREKYGLLAPPPAPAPSLSRYDHAPPPPPGMWRIPGASGAPTRGAAARAPPQAPRSGSAARPPGLGP